MTHEEFDQWFLDATDYFPRLTALATKTYTLWRTRLGPLPLERAQRGLEAYVVRNSRTPSLADILAQCGLDPDDQRDRHVHTWEDGQDGAILCTTCGRHGHGCRCPWHACLHVHATVQGDGHRYCPDCRAVIGVRDEAHRQRIRMEDEQRVAQQRAARQRVDVGV